MRRNVLSLLVAVMCFAMVTGCATVIKPVPAQDLNPKVKSGALVQKTNNFEVILDTSASMDEALQLESDLRRRTSPTSRPRSWSTCSTWRGFSTTRFRT